MSLLRYADKECNSKFTLFFKDLLSDMLIDKAFDYKITYLTISSITIAIQ